MDILIIGAGPAGIQTALSLFDLCRKHKKPLTLKILDANSKPGGSFHHYPVHGTLISINKLHSGQPHNSNFAERFDWNSLVSMDKSILMRNYSSDYYPSRQALTEMLQDICEHYQIPIEYNTKCQSIVKKDDGFIVKTNTVEYQARYVVIATGLKPHLPNIPGIEHAIQYGDFPGKEHFTNKRVLIIGKGNSGMETAKAIENEAAVIMIASRKPAKLAYQTHYVGDTRIVNGTAIENYQLKQLTALLDCEIESIEKNDNGQLAVTVNYFNAKERETLLFDKVICAAGFKGNFQSVFPDMTLTIEQCKFPKLDENFQSVDIDDVFFAGVLTHGADYRSFSSSGFIHGFRYNCVILAQHLFDRFHPNYKKPLEVGNNEQLATFIINELNNDPAMYLQAGFIYEIFQRNSGGDWYYIGHKTKVWYQAQTEKNIALLAVSLEYGTTINDGNVLALKRYPGFAEKSPYLHPIIRFQGSHSEKTALHLEEHLENDYWANANNYDTLTKFLEKLSIEESVHAH